MATDCDGNLGSRTSKGNVSRICLQAEGSSGSLSQEQSVSGRALCVARIVCIESMNNYLVWPVTAECKGKT